MAKKFVSKSAVRKTAFAVMMGASALGAAFSGLTPYSANEATALASEMRCDFSEDGIPDTVTGIPGKTVNGKLGAGAIMVRYQFAGLEFPVVYESAGITAAIANHYGASLECGDFNGDGADDLAIGVPGYGGNAGAVVVMYSNGTELTATAAFTQDTAKGGYNVPGAKESGDQFGFSLAAGDFNNDGEDDLAIGAPGEDVTIGGKSFADAGAVIVLNGSGASGLTANGELFDVTSIGSEWVKAKAQGYYGYALATGDFDADSIEDLAIGMPGATVQDWHSKDVFKSVGLVQEMRGNHHSGLAHHQYSWEGLFWPNNGPEVGDKYGFALGVGDFDNNGLDDIAIGAPGDWAGPAPDFCDGNVCEDPGTTRPGKLFIVKHTEDQFGNGSYVYTSFAQGDPGVPGEAEHGDFFGYAIAVGQFDGKYGEDIAVGAPGENWGQGAITAFYSGGFREVLWQGDWDIEGVPDEDDWFGFSMAATDEDNDGVEDLIVGVPQEDYDGVTNAGVTNTIFGVQDVGLGAGTLFHLGEDDGYQDWEPADTNHKWPPLIPMFKVDYSGEGYGFAVTG